MRGFFTNVFSIADLASIEISLKMPKSVNSYFSTVIVWGQQNYVVPHTFYLKDCTKADIVIQGLKGKDIAQNTSKCWPSGTSLATLEKIWILIYNFESFLNSKNWQAPNVLRGGWCKSHLCFFSIMHVQHYFKHYECSWLSKV